MKKIVIFLLLVLHIHMGLSQTVMYFIEAGGIERSLLDSSQRKVLLPGSQYQAQGMAIDAENQRMYWTDWITDKIQVSSLNGRNVQDLVTTGLSLPEGIAVDPAGGKMYWVDSGTKKIQRANLDGTDIEDLVIYSAVNLDGIALDPQAGKMYWTDWGAGAAVGRVRTANLDGSQVRDLFTVHNGILKGIALDLSAGKIYWTDCAFNKIQRSNLNGSQVEDLITNGISTPNSLVLDTKGGKMYWTNLGTKKIQRANMDGSGLEDLITNLTSPEGVALVVCEDDGCVPDVATGIRSIPQEPFRLYPNPTQGTIFLDKLSPGDEIQIQDVQGRNLQTKRVTDPGESLDLSHLPTGFLLLQVFREGHLLMAGTIVRE